MKGFSSLHRSLCRFLSSPAATNSNEVYRPSTTTAAAADRASSSKINHRLSNFFSFFFNNHHRRHRRSRRERGSTPLILKEEQEEDSFISPSLTTITGTIYGHRNGHVITFCVQSDPATPPLFLHDLSIPTKTFAKEMNTGVVRIAVEQFNLNTWKTYCNGRKAGSAVRRRPAEKDMVFLKTILGSVSAGTGSVVLPGSGGEIVYMRASYKHVVGSPESDSYHMINPGGESHGQELSIFLLRNVNKRST